MNARSSIGAGLVVALTSIARPIAAAPGSRARPVDANKVACASAYEAAQEERIKKQLIAARGHLVACGATTCPAAMQRECLGWLSEVDAAMPTVVLRAWLGEREITEVRVLVDGTEVAAHLDGSAVPLDPGPHVFRFEHAGDAPIEERHVIDEGQKLAPIEARFAAAVAPPRKIGLPIEIAAVTSAVGLASFAAFGAAGLVQYEHLKSTCSPNCSQSESNVVKTRFAISDVSLGVGVVAAGLAAALYFTGKRATSEPAPSALRIDLAPSTAGVCVRASSSF